MFTWHLTMKLFPAICHERATVRKLWRQTGNRSLLPAQCWLLLHVMAGICARFSNFAFVLFCYVTNHLMTGPLGNSQKVLNIIFTVVWAGHAQDVNWRFSKYSFWFKQSLDMMMKTYHTLHGFKVVYFHALRTRRFSPKPFLGETK